MMHTFYFIPAKQKERQVEQHTTQTDSIIGS